MRRVRGVWEVEKSGWGLLHARTVKPINPPALISDELIEMTDWELQDFAVQVIRQQLEKEGRRLMSWQGNPSVDPSVWFEGDHGPEWVVVRAVRYPKEQAELPANWNDIASGCARIGARGNFASVAVVSANDPFDNAKDATPLWRGHPMYARYTGLLSKNS